MKRDMSVLLSVGLCISKDIDSPSIPTAIDPSATRESLENPDTARVFLYLSAA